MKIIELIKSFKFLDFRKYISANLLTAVFCIFLALIYIHATTNYPLPVEVSSWGEPYFEYSPEENKNMTATMICTFVMMFLVCLFVAEFLLRVTIELVVKKFFPKCVNKQLLISKLKVPKFITLTYSIVFYLLLIIITAIVLLVLYSILV